MSTYRSLDLFDPAAGRVGVSGDARSERLTIAEMQFLEARFTEEHIVDAGR